MTQRRTGVVVSTTNEALARAAQTEIKLILQNPILLPSEVALLLRLSEDETLKLAEEGHLPCIKLSNAHTRFLRRDVLLRLADNRRQKAGVEKEIQEWTADEEEEYQPTLIERTRVRARRRR